MAPVDPMSAVPPRRGQAGTWFALALIAVLVCGGALYYFLVLGMRPGNVMVVATPSDVTVYLDGKEQPGQGTPVTIRSLKPGPYILSVFKPGYARWTGTVDVKPGKTERVSLKLDAMASATIELRTAPSGGKAYLDGTVLDDVTPMRITQVTPGQHRLEVRKPPYQPWVLDFEVQPDQVLKLNGRLLPATVSVKVKSLPRAEVMLIRDGRTRKMGTSPVTFQLNPKLPYVVAVVKDGYEEWRRPVAFQGGQPVEIRALLEKADGRKKPDEDEDEDGDGDRGKNTGDKVDREPRPPNVRQPRPRPRLRRRAAAQPKPRAAAQPKPRAAAQPKPRAAAQPKPRVAAQPKPRGMGTLLINSNPWTRIIIDGKYTGLTTPQRSIPLPAGRHVVTLRNPAFGIDVDIPVVVRAGKRTKIIRRNLKGR